MASRARSSILYIVKENRTYDQCSAIFREGMGTGALRFSRIGDAESPCAREEFVHSTIFTSRARSVRMPRGPLRLTPRTSREDLALGYGTTEVPYPAEGGFPSQRRRRLLVGSCQGSGSDLQDYGEFVQNGRPLRACVPLVPVSSATSIRVSQLRQDYPDVKRAARFISEFRPLRRKARSTPPDDPAAQ